MVQIDKEFDEKFIKEFGDIKAVSPIATMPVIKQFINEKIKESKQERKQNIQSLLNFLEGDCNRKTIINYVKKNLK